MTGEGAWLPVLIILFGLFGTVAMAWLALRQWRVFSYRRVQLECPGSGELVDVIAKSRVETSECKDIEYCTSSVLSDPDCVNCEKKCMGQLREPSATES
jgi:hypothetical protein